MEDIEVVEYEEPEEFAEEFRVSDDEEVNTVATWDESKRSRIKATKKRDSDSKESDRNHDKYLARQLRERPTPEIYWQAASVYLDMEEGVLGDPKKWTFPPSKKGKKTSNREILVRIGWPKTHQSRVPVRTWLESDNFLTCVEVARSYRSALRLKSSFKHYEILKIIGREGLMLLFARMMEAKEGLRPISDSILFNNVPRILRLIAEVRGDIEAAGVSVNVIQNNIANIEDPERQESILDTLATKLQEKYEQRAKEIGDGLVPGLPEGS